MSLLALFYAKDGKLTSAGIAAAIVDIACKSKTGALSIICDSSTWAPVIIVEKWELLDAHDAAVLRVVADRETGVLTLGHASFLEGLTRVAQTQAAHTGLVPCKARRSAAVILGALSLICTLYLVEGVFAGSLTSAQIIGLVSVVLGSGGLSYALNKTKVNSVKTASAREKNISKIAWAMYASNQLALQETVASMPAPVNWRGPWTTEYVVPSLNQLEALCRRMSA